MTVLLLTEDIQVREIAREFPDVEEHYRILLPARDATDLLLERRRFTERALEAGYPIPRTHVLGSAEEIADLPATVGFPFILKPYLRHSCRIEGPGDLAAYTSTLSELDRSSIVAQEWVDGGDDQLFFCLLLLGDDGALQASFLGRKLRQCPPQYGATSFAASWENPELVAYTARIFRELGGRGYCAMEYKYDAARDEFVIMEPTIGRFDQQIALTMAAGVNFPRLAADRAFGVASAESRRRRRGGCPGCGSSVTPRRCGRPATSGVSPARCATRTSASCSPRAISRRSSRRSGSPGPDSYGARFPGPRSVAPRQGRPHLCSSHRA